MYNQLSVCLLKYSRLKNKKRSVYHLIQIAEIYLNGLKKEDMAVVYQHTKVPNITLRLSYSTAHN